MINLGKIKLKPLITVLGHFIKKNNGQSGINRGKRREMNLGWIKTIAQGFIPG
jgi:hypothetical protein